MDARAPAASSASTRKTAHIGTTGSALPPGTPRQGPSSVDFSNAAALGCGVPLALLGTRCRQVFAGVVLHLLAGEGSTGRFAREPQGAAAVVGVQPHETVQVEARAGSRPHHADFNLRGQIPPQEGVQDTTPKGLRQQFDLVIAAVQAGATGLQGATREVAQRP